MQEDKTYFLRKNATLFDACLNTFSSSSFESASLNDIIRLSGLNKGSFYYHYSDKFDLYLSLINSMFIEQNVLLKNRHWDSLSSGLEVLFSSLVSLSKIDNRYLRLNRFLFLEDDAFYRRVTQSSVGSPYDLFLSRFTIDTELKGLSIRYFYTHFDELSIHSEEDLSELVSYLLFDNYRRFEESFEDQNNHVFEIAPKESFNSDVEIIFPTGSKLAIVEADQEQSILPSFISEIIKDSIRQGVSSEDFSYFVLSNQSLLMDLSTKKLSHHLSNNIITSLRFLGLQDIFKKPSNSRSYEEKLILTLLIRLSQKPSILVLNHIVSSLSPFFKEKLSCVLLNYLPHETTIIMCDKELEYLHPFCDLYYFVNNNRIRTMMHREQIDNLLHQEQRLVTFIEDGVLMKSTIHPDSLESFIVHSLARKIQIQEIVSIKQNYRAIQSQIQGGIRL